MAPACQSTIPWATRGAGASLPPPWRARTSPGGCGPPSPLVGEGRGEGGVRPGRPVGHMGYHRRVRYLDVVTNKKRIDAERGKALNALAEQTQALKMR